MTKGTQTDGNAEGGGGSEPPSDLGDSILSEMCKDFLGIEEEGLAAGQAAIMGGPLLPATDPEPQAPPHRGQSGVYRTVDDMGAAESEAAERARKRVLLQQAPYQSADQAAAFSRDGRQLDPRTAGAYAGFACPLLGAHQPYGAPGLGYPPYGHLGYGAIPGYPPELASTSYSMAPAVVPMGGPVPAGLPPAGLAVPAPGGAPVKQEQGKEAVATAAAKGPDDAGKAPASRPGQRKDMSKRRQQNREASKRYRDRARQRENHVRGLEEELGTLRQQLLDLSTVPDSFSAERGELVKEAGMIAEERKLLEKKRDQQRRRSVHLAEREAELLKLQQQLMATAAGEGSGVTNSLGFQGPWHASGQDTIYGGQQENTSADSGVSQEGSRAPGEPKSSGSVKKDRYPGLYTDTLLNSHSLMFREVVDMARASQPQFLRCYSDVQKEILALSYSGRGGRKTRFWTLPATIRQ